MQDTYHLVGVAGVGMNPLAQAILAAGWQVSGSDRFHDKADGQPIEVLAKLQKAGVRLFPQDGSGVTSATRAVVVSTAIEADNPDLAAAHARNLPILHRSEMLAELARDRECIAITGTCGKTTVTGMVGWLLEQLGADPTVVNGGIVLNWMNENRIGNVRVGKKGPWVIEADESDRSLLRFHPDWAVITNISADHFSLEESRQLFHIFEGQVKKGVVGGDDTGVPPDFSPRISSASVGFTFSGHDFEVPLPGTHNAANALQAVMLMERMGYPLEKVGAALKTFRGIHRRLEVAGRGRVTVIDDYAHNPAKITAAWTTVVPYHRRVIGVWRPHGFGPLAQMREELEKMLACVCRAEDRLFVLPVFYAGGTANRQVDSDMFVESLKAKGIVAEWVRDYPTLEARLVELAQPGDVILSMGARDPELPRFAHRIALALNPA